MPDLLRRWLPLALVVFFALWLRTHDLAARPMHADEANQAVKTGELLEHGRYAFDPRDHHGPVLYYAALPIAWVRGQRTLASLDETTLRLVPALAGTASVGLLFLLALPFGWWPALAAAAFLAVSPAAVYYSRYFVQETMLGTFTLGLLVCARQWWKSRALGWALTSGVCAGLMQSSKASAPLFVCGAIVAAIFTPSFAIGLRQRPRLARDAVLAVAIALVIAAVFYSSFGTHPAGLGDALATYRLTAERIGAGATGHEKPWPYYLQLFGVQRWGGFTPAQFAFPALTLVGAVLAIISRRSLARWVFAYAVLVVLLLSSSAYKTPWHAIHFVPPFALLIAVAIDALAKARAAVYLAAGVAAIALPSQVYQTRFLAFLRPADARNPFAYVHSAPDVKKYRALADAALARAPTRPIRVISEEYWPLPWYFRGLEKNSGYWPTPPADCDGALVIASEHQAAAVRARLRDRYDESILGLRPGFICVVFSLAP
jgi:uncharacterized protein (TIGR03663 family)